MTNVNGTRIERLDEAADKIVATSFLSTELFALVDELNAQPDLGRALTDPALEAEGRGKLAGALLGKRLSGPTVDFVVQIGPAVGNSPRGWAARRFASPCAAQTPIRCAPS